MVKQVPCFGPLYSGPAQKGVKTGPKMDLFWTLYWPLQDHYLVCALDLHIGIPLLSSLNGLTPWLDVDPWSVHGADLGVLLLDPDS